MNPSIHARRVAVVAWRITVVESVNALTFERTM